MKHFQLPLPSFGVFILGWQLFATHALAQWSTNPAVNNAICTNFYNQDQLQMISDGSGGAIITWVDYRFQPSYTIFAQRISSNGIVQWTADGVQVSSSSINNVRPSITTDGRAGAIITWVTSGDFGNLFAQRIGAGGTLMWTANGVVICSTSVSNQVIPVITSDGNGGGIIAWCDSRTDFDVYAQRIDSSGVVRWTTNGIAMNSSSGFQGGSLQITSDGSGGAIGVWEDQRSGTTVEIFAQKVSAAGTLQWATNGVVLNSVGGGGSLYPQLISDAGGAIVCWADRRNGNTDWNIYTQKVNASGAIQWALDGVAICLTGGNQSEPQLTSDGAGGAIITWDQPVSAVNPDPNIYAQRVNASGAVQWTANGVNVCVAANGQRFPKPMSDGNGGAVLTWQDSRTGNIQDIYAQRINSSGSPLWPNDGVAVCTATFVQTNPIILNDGINGMIIAWPDYRSDLGAQRHDIYAQRVRADGTLGGATGVHEDDPSLPATFNLRQNYPNPFNPTTNIEFRIASFGFVSLRVLDLLGREVATLVNEQMEPGRYERVFDAGNLSGGVYLYSLKAGNLVETKKLMMIR